MPSTSTVPLPTVSVPCPFDASVSDRVRYGCSCGCARPVSRLYFCRHCLEPRCPHCVSHEVDSHYCPNCLENMPSAEARLKRNRCANCFDCPVCGHTLSTRATSVQAPSAEDPSKTVPKKVYYLACAFCRWTSRDVGMPDQSVASGGWPDRENPHLARLSSLQEHYRALAQKEKLDRESKRFVGRKLSYMQLSDKYGLTAAVARRRAGLPPIGGSPFGSPAHGGGGGQDGGARQAEPAAAEAKPIEEVEVLPEDLFDKEVDLCSVTSLDQRLLNLDAQPESMSDVFPRHKHLMIKRSQRCRKCEHNLSKPEYNPSSIKFKIQLAAFYHVPEVVVFAVEDKIRAGQEVRFVVKVSNPTQHSTRVRFLELAAYEEDTERRRKQEEEEASAAAAAAKDASSGDAPPGGSATKQDLRKKLSTGVLRPASSAAVTASELHKAEPNAELIPLTPAQASAGVLVPPRDDAAEFDESASSGSSGSSGAGVAPDDDRELVRWRRANKVGVALRARVSDAVRQGDQVVAALAITFLYTNTISALEQREVQTADICMPVYVVLGTAVE